ncbi:MAG: M48 family metallopeptidase [Povalibacter sp.]
MPMSKEFIYPAGPSGVPSDLTRPTSTYRLHAWLAMAGLALFVALYLALASWFSWTSYRLFIGLMHGRDPFWGFVAGASSGFLAVFMWKALFFVQHRYTIDDVEVTAEEQPRLFAFINRLADEAGAPRAHRVFLSPRVNAAVFYDLRILNLLFPSRKNLEIGLGLVNAVSLGELKAVLAHEFGHFAQRSMAVGRWVYIAQQIAGHIISGRDALDGFLRGLSRFDFRIAWIGWLLSIVVWSIRSLMETVFRIVLLAQRALSREMELQADLVAVSLTGSDALIHALQKLRVADEAWAYTMSFADSEARAKRSVSDLFAVQAHITTKLREVLNDPQYGECVPLPAERPNEHRVFKASLAQPPRMWSTHPANSERENNAKRTYVPAAIDARSAWELFDDVPELKKQLSVHVFRSVSDADPVPLEDSIARIDEQYGRAYYDRSYRGAYLGRSIARHATDVSELYGPTLHQDHVTAEIDAIYPPSLAQDLERLRSLEEECQVLQGLKEGFLTAPGGIIRHRGKELKRADLEDAVDDLKEELERTRTAVIAHDRRCRSVHLAAATALGGGWDSYLKGLATILHYAEHALANLHDAHGALCNVFTIVTADGRVSNSERSRLLRACNELHNALRHIYEDEGQKIVLDRTLRRRMKVESWQEALGNFGLPLADTNNLGEWMKAIDSWVGATASALTSLRTASLEQLLLAESQVARFHREKMQPAAAPEATTLPGQYPVLLPGKERPRQKKLDLWDRFHVADGIVPTLARLTVASGIIAAVMSVGTFVGVTLVNVYNGLGQPVTVSIGEQSLHLAPFSHGKLSLGDDEDYSVRTITDGGNLVEQFDTTIPMGSSESVYNVAGASVLVEWTALYGAAAQSSEHVVGPVRWTTTDASFVFEQPPEQISTRSSEGGGTRTVISAFGHDNPSALLSAIQDEKQRTSVIATHARWDQSDLPNTAYWLALASQSESFAALTKARLELYPNDVLTLRAEQDYARADQHIVVCKRHTALAAAHPDNMDLQYVAARCSPDNAQRDQLFADLHKRSPQNGWLALAVSYTHTQHARWQDAITAFEIARQKLPGMRERLSLDTLRVRRMLSADGDPRTDDLSHQSQTLDYFLTLKSGAGLQPGLDMAYYHLGRGAPDIAIKEFKSESEMDPRVLRLAAASDGASGELIDAALALPLDKGMDPNTMWTALALALRERKDPAPYLTAIRSVADESTDRMLEFITVLRRNKNHVEAEKLLDGLDLELRAQAYSAALVLEGQQAPAEWRRASNQLLFIPERPFFAASRSNPESLTQPDPGANRTLPHLSL